jgi:hypothetical protein
MRELQKAVAEDFRRFGLVLIGAGVLTDVSAVTRVLAIAFGLILVASAYIVLAVRGDDP